MKCVALFFLVASTGCLATGGGNGPTDSKMFMVRDAIGEVALKSFEKYVRGDNWTMRYCTFGNGSEQWHSNFTCLPTGEDAHTSQKMYLLPASEYVRILTPIRADVLAAVEKTGVSVSGASPVALSDGPVPLASFTINYLRKNGEVAGEVVGTLEPDFRGSSAQDRKWTDIKVTLREWTTGGSP